MKITSLMGRVSLTWTFLPTLQGRGAANKKLGAVSAPAPPSKRRGYQEFFYKSRNKDPI